MLKLLDLQSCVPPNLISLQLLAFSRMVATTIVRGGGDYLKVSVLVIVTIMVTTSENSGGAASLSQSLGCKSVTVSKVGSLVQREACKLKNHHRTVNCLGRTVMFPVAGVNIAAPTWIFPHCAQAFAPHMYTQDSFRSL